MIKQTLILGLSGLAVALLAILLLPIGEFRLVVVALGVALALVAMLRLGIKQTRDAIKQMREK